MHLLEPEDTGSDEATERDLDRYDAMREDLETYRAYLAGPCDDACKIPGLDCRQKHYTAWYEEHRGTVVQLNFILAGDFNRAFWAEAYAELDQDPEL